MEKSSLPLLFCVLLVGRPAWTLDLTGIINGVINEIKPNLTNVNVPEIVLGSNILTDVNIVNLDTINAAKVDATAALEITNLTINFLEDVEVSGDYDFTNLTLPGPITIFGSGPFKLGLRGVTLFARAKLMYRGQKLRMEDLKELDVKLETDIKFENIMGGGPLGDFLNNLLTDVAGNLIRMVVNKISVTCKTDLEKVLTVVLNCVDISAVGSTSPMLNCPDPTSADQEAVKNLLTCLSGIMS